MCLMSLEKFECADDSISLLNVTYVCVQIQGTNASVFFCI